MEQQVDVPAATTYYLAQGATVETQTPDLAVVQFGGPVSAAEYILHIILTVLTFGLWLPVLVIRDVTANSKARRIMITRGGVWHFKWTGFKWKPTTK